MIGNACNTNNIHEAITSANPQAQTDIVGYNALASISLVSLIKLPLTKVDTKFLEGLVPKCRCIK